MNMANVDMNKNVRCKKLWETKQNQANVIFMIVAFVITIMMIVKIILRVMENNYENIKFMYKGKDFKKYSF